MKSAASLETPGMRNGAGAPTMPAASRLPCGAHVSRGLAELASLKQLRALIRLSLRCSAAPQRPARGRGPNAVDTLRVFPPLLEPGVRCGVGAPSAPLRSAAFRG